jgi:hypothetical protein
MFKINKHRFSNKTFLNHSLNLDTNFYFFHNYRVIQKTLTRTYVPPPPPSRPSFGSRLEFGNHCCKTYCVRNLPRHGSPVWNHHTLYQHETRAVASESEGILGGVESVKMYRLRLCPQSKILTRYSNSRALIATVTIRLVLKYRL